MTVAGESVISLNICWTHKWAHTHKHAHTQNITRHLTCNTISPVTLLQHWRHNVRCLKYCNVLGSWKIFFIFLFAFFFFFFFLCVYIRNAQYFFFKDMIRYVSDGVVVILLACIWTCLQIRGNVCLTRKLICEGRVFCIDRDLA